jgi:hypothetical protein
VVVAFVALIECESGAAVAAPDQSGAVVQSGMAAAFPERCKSTELSEKKELEFTKFISYT